MVNVIFETTKGNIEVELDEQKAPVTVNNFLLYVDRGHFDGTVFHRVIKGFMIQGGGFTQEGDQKQTLPPIKLESKNGLKNSKGTIAMARTMIEDSATAQFFVNTVDNAFLNYSAGNPGYAVFGKVVSGMEAVMSIEGVKTSSKHGMADWPVEDVVIKRAYRK
jgi:peptidyl-prolyl cis-trans isomerase B (cyclophilin B)